MTAAVTRRDRAGQPIAPEQAITAAEALDAYTRGGAVAVGLEDVLGTIAAGLWADLAVLSGDPLATPADELSAITVEQTWLGGAVRLRTRMNTTRTSSTSAAQWVDAANGGTWDVVNPATEEVVATVPFGTAADCARRDRRRRTPPSTDWSRAHRRTSAARCWTSAAASSAPTLDALGAHHGARERQAARAGARRVERDRRPARVVRRGGQACLRPGHPVARRRPSGCWCSSSRSASSGSSPPGTSRPGTSRGPAARRWRPAARSSSAPPSTRR